MKKQMEIKIHEREIVFFRSQLGTRWSFRIGGGYYRVNRLLLTEAMEHAKCVLIREVENKMDREIKKVKREKNIKNIKDNLMENLMTVIGEANKDVAELKKNWKNDGDVADHYKPFYERVKDQCDSLPFFMTICVQDFKMRQRGMFPMGGGIAKEGEDLTIEIK